MFAPVGASIVSDRVAVIAVLTGLNVTIATSRYSTVVATAVVVDRVPIITGFVTILLG